MASLQHTQAARSSSHDNRTDIGKIYYPPFEDPMDSEYGLEPGRGEPSPDPNASGAQNASSSVEPRRGHLRGTAADLLERNRRRGEGRPSSSPPSLRGTARDNHTHQTLQLTPTAPAAGDDDGASDHAEGLLLQEHQGPGRFAHTCMLRT